MNAEDTESNTDDYTSLSIQPLEMLSPYSYTTGTYKLPQLSPPPK